MAAIAFVVIFAVVPAAAGEDDPAMVEPLAEELLAAALGRIAAAPAFSFRAEITHDVVLPSGLTIEYSSTYDATLRRPDRFVTRLEGEQRNAALWYDGRSLTLLSGKSQAYATWPAPDRIDALLDTVREELGFRPPLAMLFRESLSELALRRVTAGFCVGRGIVRGASCHHLVFRQEAVDWQIWIAAEGEPEIRRILINRKRKPETPSLTATFVEWDFDVHPADDLFTFVPPPGAIRAEFLSKGNAGQATPAEDGR